MQRIAVLGGGVAGVVAAAELARAGAQVTLYEMVKLGGLHRSVEIDGDVYDIGAFVFGRDHELFRVFPSLRERFLAAHPRHRSITPSGNIDRYPSTLHGFVRDNGVVRSAVAVASLMWGKLRHRDRSTFPSLVRYYLGDQIYERSGFRTYVERLYDLPEREIDLEFARTRLAFLQDVCSLRRRSLRALLRLIRYRVRNVDSPDVLLRPREGFGVVYDEVERELRSLGVQVRVESCLQAVRRAEDGAFLIDLPGGTERFDRVVSTLPIPTMQRLIGVPREVGLQYMKLVSLFYRFDGDTGHDGAVLCNLTSSGWWKRLVCYRTLYGGESDHEHLVVEVTTRDAGGDFIALADADFRRHVSALSYFRGTLTLQGSLVTEHAYPVYRVADAARLREARRALQAWGLDLAGRQGRFDYATSAVVAEKARAVASAIASGDRTVERA